MARIRDEMRKAGQRPAEKPGLGVLARALAHTEGDLGRPALLEAIAENWKRARASDIDGVLRALELQLWRVHQEPSDLVVEQVGAHPQLRKVLRRIAQRHLDTDNELLAESLPETIELIDGYVAVILADPELRSIRWSTFAVRRRVGGTWPDLTRAMVRAVHQPVARCVISHEGEERGAGDHESMLVLAPSGDTCQLEIDSDEEGTVTRAVWTALDQHQRPLHLHKIELLHRVSELEERERQTLGRVPRRTQAARTPLDPCPGNHEGTPAS